MKEEIIEIEGNSLKEAWEQINSRIPSGFFISSEKILEKGEQMTIKQKADTVESAMSNASSKIPGEATIISKSILQNPQLEIIRISADDETSAVNSVSGRLDKNKMIKKTVLAIPGVKGFLGIGKSQNQFDVEVLNQAIVEISYKNRVKIAVGMIAFKTVKIENQEWMAENLNIDHFRNGDPIREVKTSEEWKNAGTRGYPAWCYFVNSPENGNEFGKLYNWHAVNDQKNLAPKGWHIPSKKEFEMLRYNSNYNSIILNGSSGFDSLICNWRNYFGDFMKRGRAFYWSKSTANPGTAYDLTIDSADESVGVYFDDQGMGFSVRCIKD